MTAPAELTVTDQIRELIAKVALQREEAQQRRALIASKREAFETSIEHDTAALKALQLAVDANEETLRLMAVAHYGATEERKPAPGVEVVITKRVDIDRDAGLKWATDHGLFLIPASLDVKAVEKAAKVTPLPFVTLVDVPAARIASDLTKALGAML